LKRTVNRLAPDSPAFGGRDIDRGRPLRFRLDGVRVEGFVGDTVLTAALASGLLGAGRRHGAELALDAFFSPQVVERSAAGEPARALPMERTPALDGLDLVSFPGARQPGWRHRVTRLADLAGRPPRRLRRRYDGAVPLAGPWLTMAASRELLTDVAIIGGGLAGLNAAIAAARSGERVVLVERRQTLGGDARFFGSVGDEETPETLIERAITAVRALPNITVLVLADAFAIEEGEVRLHQVDVRDGHAVGEVISLRAPRIVLATGTVERLPIFPGNRLPRVVRAVTAYDHADRFGIWIGRRAMLATTTSVAYRAATQAKNAGIAFERIADTRVDPHSRFVEFGKAHGIQLARGLQPLRVEPAPRGRPGIIVQFGSIFGVNEQTLQQFETEQLVVSGGWQPELTLWHMAGGGSAWQHGSARIEAKGALNGIALAGAAAGYRNASACARSGEAAVAALLARRVPAVEDPQIDAMHETPDDATPIAPPTEAELAEAYLDVGSSLAVRPSLEDRPRLAFWARRPAALWGFSDQARPLSLGDVAAGVQLGVIPPEEATIVVQERCATPGDIVDAGRQSPAPIKARPASGGPPPYLAGRFGLKPATWVVEATDGRAFEPGCLIYFAADRTDPRNAIGAVYAAAPEGRTGGLALIGEPAMADGMRLFVRDRTGSVAARAIDPNKPVAVAVPQADPLAVPQTRPLDLPETTPAEVTGQPISHSEAAPGAVPEVRPVRPPEDALPAVSRAEPLAVPEADPEPPALAPVEAVSSPGPAVSGSSSETGDGGASALPASLPAEGKDLAEAPAAGALDVPSAAPSAPSVAPAARIGLSRWKLRVRHKGPARRVGLPRNSVSAAHRRSVYPTVARPRPRTRR
jgi:sarcosine oxidase subunit alpha